VKSLLTDKLYLLELQKLGFVEIGQRHKALYTKPNGTLGVKAPEFNPWSRSLLFSQAVELLSTVASFTQPSHISNDWITQKISEWSLSLQPKNILEFGSGIGNLSFASLANSKTQLTALEFDSLSFEALQLNAKALGVQNQIKAFKGDFRKTLDESFSEPFDLLVLNPARNGVGNLLKNPKKLPENVIYMSCYPESFDLDIQNLVTHGYSLKEIWIVDQFPQTQHMEILSLWQR
jgi:23S rRNA (uracil1939-C5)-methyltransferase